MRSISKVSAVFFILVAGMLYSQSSDLNTIKESGNGIYFMYYDSSNSKSTIVEFEDFLALIEAPVKDQGGNARELKDHEHGGDKFYDHWRVISITSRLSTFYTATGIHTVFQL